MDLDRYSNKLHEKQKDLQDQIARLQDEARGTTALEVKDHAEVAAIDQGNTENLESATVLTTMLEDVRDALQRIKDGTYGTCIVCEQPIEPARLEAVPWTLYCRRHQEEEDQKQAERRNADTREAAQLFREAKRNAAD